MVGSLYAHMQMCMGILFVCGGAMHRSMIALYCTSQTSCHAPLLYPIPCRRERQTRQVRRKRFNWNLASQLASSPPVFSSFQRGMHVVDQQEASSSAQWLQICMYACIGLAFPLFMLLMPLMIYILVWLVSMLVRQTM